MSAGIEPVHDLLLQGATLLTGTEVIRDGWLAISGDRIAALGRSSPPAAKKKLALDGHVVTPGFINVHTHSALTMVRGVAADLGFAPSYTKGTPLPGIRAPFRIVPGAQRFDPSTRVGPRVRGGPPALTGAR